MLKSVFRFFVAAALLLSPVAGANDRPDASRSAHLAVTVAVVRGADTASPEAAVRLVRCEDSGGSKLCHAAETPEAPASEQTSQPCTTAERSTMCWY